MQRMDQRPLECSDRDSESEVETVTVWNAGRKVPETIFDATTEVLRTLQTFRDQPHQLFDNDVWVARQLADFTVWAYASGAIEPFDSENQLDGMVNASFWDINKQTRLGPIHRELMIGYIFRIALNTDALSHINKIIRQRTFKRITYKDCLAACTHKVQVETAIRGLNSFTRFAQLQPFALRPEPLLTLNSSYRELPLFETAHYEPIFSNILEPTSHLQQLQIEVDPANPGSSSTSSGITFDPKLDPRYWFVRINLFRRHRINTARKEFLDSKRFDYFKGSYYVPVQEVPDDVEVVNKQEGEELSDQLWNSLSDLRIVPVKDSDAKPGQNNSNAELVEEALPRLQGQILKIFKETSGKANTPIRRILFNEKDKLYSAQELARKAKSEASATSNRILRLSSAFKQAFPLNISAVKSNAVQWIREVPHMRRSGSIHRNCEDEVVQMRIPDDKAALDHEKDKKSHMVKIKQKRYASCLCPCCFVALPWHLSRTGKWRGQHLPEDLLPFACVHPDCYRSPSPALFSDITEWIKHMTDKHYPTQPYWICRLCTPSKRREYPTPTETHFLLHIWDAHKVQSKTDLFLKLFRVEGKLELPNCVLCPPNQQPTIEQGKTMLQHVTEHMFLFALFAIPEILESVDGSAAPRSAPNSPATPDVSSVHHACSKGRNSPVRTPPAEPQESAAGYYSAGGNRAKPGASSTAMPVTASC